MAFTKGLMYFLYYPFQLLSMEETVVTRQLTIKDMIASIRKAIKKECKSLSVRNAKGWVKIEGSLEFGHFTEDERGALVRLGFNDPHGSNVLFIDPDKDLNYWYKKLSFINES